MKYFAELPLARKLMLTMMATSSSGLVVACLFFMSYDVISLRHNIAERLNSLAEITGANVAAALTYNDPGSALLVLRALQKEPHIVAARVYDAHGRAFASYRSLRASPATELPDFQPLMGSGAKSDHLTECNQIVFDGEVIGSVYLVADVQEFKGRARRFAVFMLILMGVSSAAAFAVALPLKRFISRPIVDLLVTTKIVSRKKNFAIRANKYANDELGFLADSFNEMLTEIEFAANALRNAHLESELFINSVPSILIGTDSAGRITRWNSTATAVFGLSPDAVVGKPFHRCEIHWLPAHGEEGFDSWFRVEKSEKREDVMFEKDGRTHFLGLTIINVDFLPGGKRTGYLITGADITEHKILEGQLRQAQKLEAIGQLAAGIAHEINTPAQYVGDNAKFLQETWPVLDAMLSLCLRLREETLAGSVAPDSIAKLLEATDEADPTYLLREVPQAIAQTLEGVQRISKIVRAMKEFSHPGSEGKCAIDINHAIETTVAVARNEWKYVAEVHTCFEETLPLVPCFAGEFNQVILNLLINAAHAVGDKVRDSSVPKGLIKITTKRDGAWAEVQIQDTGAGVPEDIRARIFEPFFTTKEVGRGSGQGLAIAHVVIVQKHGGQIWFESEVGKGTTFYLRLPLQMPENEMCPAGASQVAVQHTD